MKTAATLFTTVLALTATSLTQAMNLDYLNLEPETDHEIIFEQGHQADETDINPDNRVVPEQGHQADEADINPDNRIDLSYISAESTDVIMEQGHVPDEAPNTDNRFSNMQSFKKRYSTRGRRNPRTSEQKLLAQGNGFEEKVIVSTYNNQVIDIKEERIEDGGRRSLRGSSIKA